MTTKTLALLFLVALIAAPLLAATADTPNATGPQKAVDTPAVACSGALTAPVLGALVSAETPEPIQMSCYDVRCEWIDQCYNEGGGWDTTYRSKVCLTSCGYWYDTGETCCWTTQPGTC